MSSPCNESSHTVSHSSSLRWAPDVPRAWWEDDHKSRQPKQIQEFLSPQQLLPMQHHQHWGNPGWLCIPHAYTLVIWPGHISEKMISSKWHIQRITYYPTLIIQNHVNNFNSVTNELSLLSRNHRVQLSWLYFIKLTTVNISVNVAEVVSFFLCHIKILVTSKQMYDVLIIITNIFCVAFSLVFILCMHCLGFCGILFIILCVCAKFFKWMPGHRWLFQLTDLEYLFGRSWSLLDQCQNGSSITFEIQCQGQRCTRITILVDPLVFANVN